MKHFHDKKYLAIDYNWVTPEKHRRVSDFVPPVFTTTTHGTATMEAHMKMCAEAKAMPVLRSWEDETHEHFVYRDTGTMIYAYSRNKKTKAENFWMKSEPKPAGFIRLDYNQEK